MTDPNKKPSSELSKRVQQQAQRKIKAQKQGEHSAWFGLGMFGLVGWSIAVPSLIGIAIGLWLDRNKPSHVSWVLTFLVIGIVIGCLNAWYWIKQESEHD